MKVVDNYCLYYIPKSSESLGDTLMIYFGENKPVTARNLVDHVITLLSKQEVVGYAILEMSNLCKIKANGTIFLPNEYLIKLINDFLKRNMIDVELKSKEHSGFVVGKLIDKQEVDKSYIYQVDIKDEVIEVESTFDIALNTLVVIAKNNTYLLPGRMVQPYETKDKKVLGNRLCTYDDLQMEVSNSYLPILIFEDELEVGQDFFLMEEKAYA